MSYQSWSVSFAEQPSASKWNILGTNDAYFNSLLTGSGTIASTVLTNPYKFSYTNASVTADNTNPLIKFATKVYDTGNNYSASTGIFTVPVTGFYFINVAGSVGVSNSGVNAGGSFIYVNGSQVRTLTAWDNSGTTSTSQGCGGGALISLTAGDSVALHIQNTYSVSVSANIEGFLVSVT